jgi:aldehyde:ferredoxin oxidoreductase
MGLSMLFDMLKPHIDPLSPENALVFGTGPLTGTLTTASGKCTLNTKYTMPADRAGTKYFVSTSTFGGPRFGAMMKNAGYDQIAITGRASKPSYLKVTDEDVEICDAGDLWGKDVYETGRILRSRHRGKTGNCGTWVVGRAGENQVRPSLAWTDDWCNAGRFAAAIGGAKNLKAVVTLGSKGIEIADSKRLLNLIDRKHREILDNPEHLAPLAGVAKLVGGNPLLLESMVGLRGCGPMCACKPIQEAKEGPYKGTWFGATYPGFPLELQSVFQLRDFGEAVKFVSECNRHGLCVVTMMNMIPFVMRLHELGFLSKTDMGGLEPRLGDLEFLLALVEKVLRKEDIGAVMAEGWYPLCERVGMDLSTDPEIGFAHCKGVDLIEDARFWGGDTGRGTGFSPAVGLAGVVHPKTKQTISATYWSNSELSFDHVKRDAERMGLTKEEMDRVFTKESFDTGRLEKYGGEAEATYNLLGICSCTHHWEYDPTRDMPWLSEVYSAVTGVDISPRELLRAGERAYNLEKLINVREGFTREDDRIPQAYLGNIETPLEAPEGDRYLADWFGKRVTREDLEEMLDHYYEERGWDIEKGVPTKKKLVELGLEEYSGVIESV